MSKRRDQFVEQLSKLGFGEADLAFVYSHMMNYGLMTYNIKQIIPYEDVKVLYTADIHRFDRSTLKVSGLSATLRDVPEIKHGVFNGIVTHALEENLRNVEWFNNHATSNALPPESIMVLEKVWKQMEVLKLSGNRDAQNIVELLQMKYLTDTYAENYTHLDMKTQRYDRPYYFDYRNEYPNVTTRDGYNLLCGRPMLRREGEQSYWFQLKRTAELNPFAWFDTHRYPAFNLEDKLQEFRLKDHSAIPELTKKLEAGEVTEAKIADGGRMVTVLLSVVPEFQLIAFVPKVSNKLSKSSKKEQVRSKVNRGL
jgi:hypothetical protein